jgi:hypothetical protein
MYYDDYRDSSVGIATRYELDGSGIESLGGEIFRTRPDRPWGPLTMGSGCFLVLKRPGRVADPPTPYSLPRS